MRKFFLLPCLFLLLTGVNLLAETIPAETFDQVAEKVLPSVVKLTALESDNANSDDETFGSGVIIDANGSILTNDHVVAKAKKVRVTFQDGTSVETSSLVHDIQTDLALVRLDTKDAVNLPVATFGDSDTAKIGESVIAIGSPFEFDGSVSKGIISGKKRVLNVSEYEDFIQTDAPINPGSSGGPLFDLNGKVIGINSAIKTKTGTYSGLSFAISSRLAQPVALAMMRQGWVNRSYIGVSTDHLDRADRLKMALSTGVKIIRMVDGDTPARRAGLKVGDVILTVGGKSITEPMEFYWRIAHTPAQNGVALTVYRDKATLTVQTSLWESQATTPKAEGNTRLETLGARVETISEASAVSFGYARGTVPAQGLLITSVEKGGLAATVGLKAGTILLEADQKKLENFRDLLKVLNDSRNLKSGILASTVQSNGKKSFIIIRK